MKRKGQALIIVVIVFALIISVFAISISTAMRSQALEETEIYQREQALYLAQMGINQMIYNINNGADYTTPPNNSITITAPGVPDAEGKAIYHKDDDIETKYGGAGYVEGIGTVNKSQSQPVTRRIFVSLTSEAFKYCLYTSTGGKDGIGWPDTNYFSNPSYGSSYFYNPAGSYTIPYPDWDWYTTNYQVYPTHDETKDFTYNPFTDQGQENVVYIHYTGNKKNATLTVKLENESSINLSIITDYPIVNLEEFGKDAGGDFTWNPVTYNGNTYPILVHSSTSESAGLTIDYNEKKTLTLNGFIYTNKELDKISSANESTININGELMASSLGEDFIKAINIKREIKFTYSNDYFTNPPPHFITVTGTKFKPYSFREEY